MSLTLKVYALKSGDARLAMLVDYLATKHNPNFFHLLLADHGTLNVQALDLTTSMVVQNDRMRNERLKLAFRLIAEKFQIEQIIIFSEPNTLLELMQQVLHYLPKHLSSTLHLNIYDGNQQTVQQRQQLFSLPAPSLSSLLNIETQQIDFWLTHPQQRQIYVEKQLTHFTWHRFFTTRYHWSNSDLPQNLPSLAEELMNHITSLQLEDVEKIKPTKKLALCKLLNIPMKTLSQLIDPQQPKFWLTDDNSTPWFNPLPVLQAFRATLKDQGLMIYHTQASNMDSMPGNDAVQLLPWWVSPAIASFFPQHHQATCATATPLARTDFWVFTMDAAMGDLLFLLGALPAFRARHSGEIIINLPAILHDLALRSPCVDAVWDLANPGDHYEEMLYASTKRRLINIFDWETILAPEHMQAAISKQLCIDYHESEQKLTLNRTPLEQQHLQQFLQQHHLIDTKVVLLHPNIGSPNRTWPQQHWLSLCNDFLADGWRVVIIGSNRNVDKEKSMPTWDDPRIVNAIDQLSPIETILLMDHCDLLVATDSGPVALAAASHIATCVLYSNIPGQYRLPIRQGKMGWNACAINSGCHFGQCGGSFHNLASRTWAGPIIPVKLTGLEFGQWCPNHQQYSCLNEFSPPQFWQAIQSFLHSDAYIPRGERPEISA